MAANGDLGRSDVKFMIMDYLINEGYPSAARKFALEANIPTTEDIESIQERVEIRNAIHRGEIQEAIERINELNHQVRAVVSSACSHPVFLLSPLR